jgi:phosphonate transport system substrate-binding protein
MFARILVLALLLAAMPARAAEPVYSFGVLSQRSAVLTAQYWNPILDYVAAKANVQLRLRVAHTAPESNEAIDRGEYDFVYANTIFRPAARAQGYTVIARPRTAPITGQIVTLEDSPVKDLAGLAGQVVGFPSRTAFVGYVVPMDHLLRAGIAVTPVFGGNQEGIMAQLKAGKVVAAGVNGAVMKNFAAREGVRYRVLWQSPAFLDLPIAAHPRVPPAVRAAVRAALIGMSEDVEGARVLEASARLLQQKPPYGFVPADDRDYHDYVEFYRKTRVPDIE